MTTFKLWRASTRFLNSRFFLFRCCFTKIRTTNYFINGFLFSNMYRESLIRFIFIFLVRSLSFFSAISYTWRRKYFNLKLRIFFVKLARRSRAQTILFTFLLSLCYNKFFSENISFSLINCVHIYIYIFKEMQSLHECFVLAFSLFFLSLSLLWQNKEK
jgi:hypothetical protein